NPCSRHPITDCTPSKYSRDQLSLIPEASAAGAEAEGGIVPKRPLLRTAYRIIRTKRKAVLDDGKWQRRVTAIARCVCPSKQVLAFHHPFHYWRFVLWIVRPAKTPSLGQPADRPNLAHKPTIITNHVSAGQTELTPTP